MRTTNIVQVLVTLPKLVRLGYYEDSEVRAALVPILGLLESSDDMPYRVDDLESATLWLSVCLSIAVIVHQN